MFTVLKQTNNGVNIMIKKITFGVLASMISAMIFTIAPNSASANGYSKLKSPVQTTADFISMNGKMSPKENTNKLQIKNMKYYRFINSKSFSRTKN